MLPSRPFDQPTDDLYIDTYASYNFTCSMKFVDKAFAIDIFKVFITIYMFESYTYTL